MTEIETVTIQLQDLNVKITAEEIRLTYDPELGDVYNITLTYDEWEDLKRWIDELKKIFTTRPEVKP
ncbi:MAG: hypothetical protein DRJ03_09385 [Chloroflexi bacterium]|nr:MAG: hypothetical protein DRJ03_09385 [Chloroflexota bacterium]RLG62718.1 MAG: hypothetical protein DRO02_07665 [archaeon]